MAVREELGSAVAPVERVETWKALLLAALFFCVTAVGIAHHEMWLDEVRAWMIARDSDSLSELVQHMRYEGHPLAWHLLLFLLSRFTRDLVAMQVLHLLLATAVAYLIARYSPFGWWQKVLLVFGYFFVYEYAVISRGYVLGVLALFACCALFPSRRQHYPLLGLLLLLLANTTVYGTILALALAGMLLVDGLLGVNSSRGFALRRVWPVAALALVGAGVALMHMTPRGDAVVTRWTFSDILARGATSRPAPSGWAAGFSWLLNVGALLGRVWTVYVPIPDPWTQHTWNSNLLLTPALFPYTQYVVPLLSLFILVGALLLFSRRPLVLLLFILGTGGIFVFSYWKFFGSVRHFGHLFILFVACLWLAPLSQRTWRVPRLVENLQARWGRRFVTVILVAQLIGGISLWIHDLRSPFSSAKAAADVLRDARFRDLVFIGDSPYNASVVAAYLDREIYYARTQEISAFPPRNLSHPGPNPTHLKRALDCNAPEAVLILDHPFSGTEELLVEAIAYVPPGSTQEHYFLYHTKRLPALPQPGEPDLCHPESPPATSQAR